MHAALVQRRTADRRKDRRFAIHGAIQMRATGIEVDIQATLEDISSGGCRVTSRVPLAMRHPVRIDLPRPSSQPLRVTGNVVRAYGTSVNRIYHYGIRFRIEGPEHRAALRAYVSMYAARLAPVRAQAADRREHGGLNVKIPVALFGPDPGRIDATILALRGDGMRVASARVLRQEWTIKADITLPADRSGSVALVTLTARVMPGVREVRGQFVQDLEFVEPSLRVRSEIEQYLHELDAASGERSRRSRGR